MIGKICVHIIQISKESKAKQSKEEVEKKNKREKTFDFAQVVRQIPQSAGCMCVWMVQLKLYFMVLI